MSKNTKTILLVFILVGIWGVIAYRIYEHTAGGVDTVNRELSYKYSAPKVIENKEYKLSLNYKDPFLGSIKRLAPDNKSIILKSSYKRKIRWPQLAYRGSVYRKKRQLGMLEYKGQLEFVRNGSLIDDLHIIMVYKDSVCLVYKNDRRTVLKDNG